MTLVILIPTLSSVQSNWIFFSEMYLFCQGQQQLFHLLKNYCCFSHKRSCGFLSFFLLAWKLWQQLTFHHYYWSIKRKMMLSQALSVALWVEGQPTLTYGWQQKNKRTFYYVKTCKMDGLFWHLISWDH